MDTKKWYNLFLSNWLFIYRVITLFPLMGDPSMKTHTHFSFAENGVLISLINTTRRRVWMANFWNNKYQDLDKYAYGTEPNDFLKERVNDIKPNGRVLCLAEGEGRNAVFLAKQGFEVSSVDISDVGVKKTKKLAELSNVHVNAQCGDLEDFEIEPHYFDAMIFIFCHLPNPLREKVFRRAISGLKENGVIIMEVYSVNQIGKGTGGPQTESLLYTLNELNEYFVTKNKFSLIHEAELEREIVEGSLHTGVGSVVQFVARRPKYTLCTLCYIINKNTKEILLAEKKRGLGVGYFNGPGGKVEKNESVKIATIRETFEETCVKLQEEDLVHCATLEFAFSDRPSIDMIVYAFLCYKWEGEPAETEEMKPQWFPINNIPYDKMWADDPHWLPQVLEKNVQFLGGFLFNDRLLVKQFAASDSFPL